MRICSVEGCETKARGLGFCNKHYIAYKHGKNIGAQPIKIHGKGHLNKKGYVLHRNDKVLKFAHVIVAEAALGRELKYPEQVHHVDENPANNQPENLVICPDNAYHKLLHARTRAMEICGNPNWKKCFICKRYSPPSELTKGNCHSICNSQRMKLYRKKYA